MKIVTKTIENSGNTTYQIQSNEFGLISAIYDKCESLILVTNMWNTTLTADKLAQNHPFLLKNIQNLIKNQI